MQPHISSLLTYPIKSCGALQHTEIALDDRGLLWDRHWMVVEDAGKTPGRFLTGRDLPRLMLIQPRFVDEGLQVSAPGRSALRLSLAQPADAPRRAVTIWGDTCEAVDEGDTAAEWFSDFLNREVRLVAMADRFRRVIDTEYVRTPTETGFGDGYPLLLISQGSLDDLNERLVARGQEAVPMSRFRPNVVVEGCVPYAEDTWREALLGDIPFEIVKPCKRCQMVTIDPTTATVPEPKEPTATLATYRRWNGGVIFGQNMVHRAVGRLKVGDVITVKASGHGWIE